MAQNGHTRFYVGFYAAVESYANTYQAVPA